MRKSTPFTGKFKIGDSVKANRMTCPNPGTVIQVEPGKKSNHYGVAIDVFPCLWLSESELDSVQPERVYEFGIGDITNADDSYYNGLPAQPLHEVKPDRFELCPKCGQPTLKGQLMTSSQGRCCPDCYDRVSG